jgi:hypothetical protein
VGTAGTERASPATPTRPAAKHQAPSGQDLTGAAHHNQQFCRLSVWTREHNLLKAAENSVFAHGPPLGQALIKPATKDPNKGPFSVRICGQSGLLKDNKPANS